LAPPLPGSGPAAHLTHALRQMSFTVAGSELAAPGNGREWFRAPMRALAGVPAAPERE